MRGSKLLLDATFYFTVAWNLSYDSTNFLFFYFLFSAMEELFPVADATTFFTDLHVILRVIALGNVRTLCHHRLVLLEQVLVLTCACAFDPFSPFLF